MDEQRGIPATPEIDKEPEKKKKISMLPVAAAVAGLCLAVGFAMKLVFPNAHHEELSVSLGSPAVSVLGMDIPQAVLYTWVIMALLILGALAVRIFAIPRFSDHPGPLQNALEAAIDAAESFTASHVHNLTAGLAPYVLTVAAYIVCSAMTELLGLRPPTTDITVTFALSIITFAMINYYGIKCNGIKGRAKQFIKPMAFMVPFKILSDVAIPISLACRLFGNMLGGMIVMNLLYMALGNFSVGIPAVLGLYFNMFHPLIQTFIFLKLSLSFIEEAVEG